VSTAKKNIARPDVSSGGLGSGIRVLARHLSPAPRLSTSAGRKENLLVLLHELRHADALTRTELARLTGLAIPTVHRLLADLLRSGLVAEEEATRATGGLGRPASLYRFASPIASVAGVDVGNETTRVAVAAANGTIIGSMSLPTPDIAEDLAGGIVESLASVIATLPTATGPLVGVGVGISASVDPAGRLAKAPIHHGWNGLPLRPMLEERISCPVVVEQDDHLSALAELSDRGTAPGVSSLLVVNYGRGIGAGVVVDGALIRGAHGRAGRIADWPANGQHAETLGQQLLPEAMTASYQAQGGTGNVVDGASLCAAARGGDPVARSIVDRAAAGIADVFLRLAGAFDPESMVLGGGFAGSFDLFDQEIKLAMSGLPDPPSVTPSVIAGQAVLIGGLIAADPFVEKWLAERVAAL
jgi:predicted NBD/HSP70 family sugar kinase